MIQYWKFVQNLTLTESAYLKRVMRIIPEIVCAKTSSCQTGTETNDAAEKTERPVPFGPETRPYKECETYQTTATVHLHSSKAVCTPNIPGYSLSTYSGGIIVQQTTYYFIKMSVLIHMLHICLGFYNARIPYFLYKWIRLLKLFSNASVSTKIQLM